MYIVRYRTCSTSYLSVDNDGWTVETATDDKYHAEDIARELERYGLTVTVEEES